MFVMCMEWGLVTFRSESNFAAPLSASLSVSLLPIFILDPIRPNLCGILAEVARAPQYVEAYASLFNAIENSF